jgi:hypothetical protein
MTFSTHSLRVNHRQFMQHSDDSIDGPSCTIATCPNVDLCSSLLYVLTMVSKESHSGMEETEKPRHESFTTGERFNRTVYRTVEIRLAMDSNTTRCPEPDGSMFFVPRAHSQISCLCPCVSQRSLLKQQACI